MLAIKGPFGSQTCRTDGTFGRFGYPPTGSQLYPSCGGVQSESGGWSDLTPPLGTLLLSIGSTTSVLGRRPGYSGPPWGVGVGGGGVPAPSPATPHAVLDLKNASAASPLLLQLSTMGIPPASAGAPKMLDPSPSSMSHRPPPTYHLARGKSSIPCQPSSLCLSICRPGRRGQ